MPIEVSDVLRVTYWSRMFDQTILNVFHMRCTVAPTEPDTLTVCQHLADKLADPASDPLLGWIPQVVPMFRFDHVRVQKVYTNREVYAQSVIAEDGTFLGVANMSIDAMSITKRTQHYGRSGVGRVQIAGCPNIHIVAGQFTDEYVTAMRAAFSWLLLSLNGGAGDGTYHWCLRGDHLALPEYDLWNIDAHKSVRTMHRRTVGLGI